MSMSPATASSTGVDSPAAIADLMRPLGAAARSAAKTLAPVSGDTNDSALADVATARRAGAGETRPANEAHVREAPARGLSAALLDRLGLDARRVEAMA